MTREYFIYIMASPTRNTYVGVTNNLERRVWEHKNHVTPGYATKIGATKLVYVETYTDVRYAIAREKELKDWRREKKIALIESQNPFWNDLSRGVVWGIVVRSEASNGRSWGSSNDAGWHESWMPATSSAKPTALLGMTGRGRFGEGRLTFKFNV